MDADPFKKNRRPIQEKLPTFYPVPLYLFRKPPLPTMQHPLLPKFELSYKIKTVSFDKEIISPKAN